MYKKLLFGWLCFVMVLGFDGAAEAQSRQWKIGHVRPAGSAIDEDIRRFADHIAAATGGAIRIEVYPGNKLGDYSVVQERVAFGEIEMYVGPFSTAIDKRVSLAFTPYLVSDWKEAKNVYSPNSRLFEQMVVFLRDQNIQIVGGWPVYFGGLALSKKPKHPKDPDSDKEMIIRVPPMRSFERTAAELGYRPYPITWTYARMGLKTGMVDGILGGGAEGYLGLAGIINYYLPLHDHFEYWFIYMNLDLWKKLTEINRTLIRRAVAEMEQQRYAVAEAQERDSLEQLRRKGVEIISFSPAERQAFARKIKNAVWPVMRRDIGGAFDTIVSQAAP